VTVPERDDDGEDRIFEGVLTYARELEEKVRRLEADNAALVAENLRLMAAAERERRERR
jgi:hypothetical protein